MTTYDERHKEGKGKEIAALLLGPLMGLVYFISLPFIAIATVVALLGKKVLIGTLGVTRNLASFGWRPTEAYLAGKKKKRRDKD
jgi:hypothetical protein